MAGVLGALVLILITAYYMAIRPEPAGGRLVSLFPPPRRDHARYVLDRVRRSWIGWMEGVAVDMLATFVLTFIGLTLIGLDFAIFFAVLSALLVVVPVLRRDRRRDPAGAVRAHRLARQGAARARRSTCSSSSSRAT